MPAGRPTKLTPAIANEILKAVRAGAYIETAAAHAGIDKTTLYLWLKNGARDESGTSEQAKFSNALKKALADAELSDLAIIGRAAMKGAWQASAWRLERKFPDRYGLTRKVNLEVRREVDRELDTIMARLEERLPRDVFKLVCEALAADVEGAGEADPDTGEGI